MQKRKIPDDFLQKLGSADLNTQLDVYKGIYTRDIAQLESSAKAIKERSFSLSLSTAAVKVECASRISRVPLAPTQILRLMHMYACV